MMEDENYTHAEKRRMVALQLALNHFSADHDPTQVVTAAGYFEAYLTHGITPETGAIQ